MKAAMTVQAIRQRSGLALRELARRAGTSHATLHSYESGAKQPRVDTIERIAEAGGFDLDLELTRRPDTGPGRAAKGRELVDALLVAEQFPARHRQRLGGASFARRK